MANMLETFTGLKGTFCTLSLALFVAITFMDLSSPGATQGQGLPPRGYTVMQTRPVVTPPLSADQRLRDDIVQSTNPATGTMNVRQFKLRTSTLPGSGADQNRVMTQYSTRTGTLPGGSSDRNMVLKPTPVRRSTLP